MFEGCLEQIQGQPSHTENCNPVFKGSLSSLLARLLNMDTWVYNLFLQSSRTSKQIGVINGAEESWSILELHLCSFLFVIRVFINILKISEYLSFKEERLLLLTVSELPVIVSEDLLLWVHDNTINHGRSTWQMTLARLMLYDNQCKKRVISKIPRTVPNL